MGPFQESGDQRTASDPSAEGHACDQAVAQYDTMMPSNDGIPSMFDDYSGGVLHDYGGFFGDREPMPELFEQDPLANLEHTVFAPEDTGFPGFDGTLALLDARGGTNSAVGYFGGSCGSLSSTPTLDLQHLINPEHIAFLNNSEMGESQTFPDEVPHNNLQWMCGRGDSVRIDERGVIGVVEKNELLIRENQRLAQENNNLLENCRVLRHQVETWYKGSQGQNGHRYQRVSMAGEAAP